MNNVFVMSDIHGNEEAFDSIMKQIQLQPEDTLYILGDVIDRHPDGIRVLRRILMSMKNNKMAIGNLKMTMGNHEKMLLDAFGTSGELIKPIDDKAMNLWMRNGGDITLSYLKHIRKETRREIFAYLSELPLEYKITIGDRRYILVHAAPPELYSKSDPRYKQFHDPEEFSVWYRINWYDQMPEGYTVVFGHTPTMLKYNESGKIYFGDNQIIGIDCGAGLPKEGSPFFSYRGRLACLRLNDMKEYYSE